MFPLGARGGKADCKSHRKEHILLLFFVCMSLAQRFHDALPHVLFASSESYRILRPQAACNVKFLRLGFFFFFFFKFEIGFLISSTKGLPDQKGIRCDLCLSEMWFSPACEWSFQPKFETWHFLEAAESIEIVAVTMKSGSPWE